MNHAIGIASFLVTFAMWVSSAFAADEVISLDGVTAVDSVGVASAHLADPGAALGFEDALRRFSEGAFAPVATLHFEAGYSITPHWLATPIRNDAADETTYRILTNLPFAPAISIMLLGDGGREEMLIEKHLETPWRDDQFLSLAVATPAFTLAPGETALLMTRFHPYGVGTLPMTIETELTAAARGGDAAFMRAAFYGFALTSILMLALYVFAIRRTDGLSLILTTLTGVVMMAQIDGVLNAYVWPQAPHWNKIASFPLLMLLSAFMLLMARNTLLSAKRPRLAQFAGWVALVSVGVVALMIWIEASTLILVGFATLIMALTLLSYGSISIASMLPLRSTVASGVGLFIFVGVSTLLTGTVIGAGDVGAQNLLNAKVMYAMMTTIFIVSYAALAAGLSQAKARFDKRELALAKASAETNAALLEAERNFHRAKEAEIRQTERLENVSHDLRQPISALKVTLEPLMGGAQGKGIQTAIDYLERLVDEQTRDDADDAFSEGQGDTAEVVPASLLVDAAAEMFSKRAQEKGLKLRRRSCAGDLHAPPIQLMRIINNLVSNAVEHTANGGVLVAARRRERYTLIQIYDTGPGMTDEEIRVFAERRQKGAVSGGDGLGLAICFELAQKSGYLLAVRSKQGKGTVFSLEVPTKEALGG